MHKYLAGVGMGLSIARCLQGAVAGSAIAPRKGTLGVTAMGVRVP